MNIDDAIGTDIKPQSLLDSGSTTIESRLGIADSLNFPDLIPSNLLGNYQGFAAIRQAAGASCVMKALWNKCRASINGGMRSQCARR